MSDDLISRSALMQSLRNNVLVDLTTNLEQAIEEQFTAYDVNNVVKQIEKCSREGGIITSATAFEKAIDIVKSGYIE